MQQQLNVALIQSVLHWEDPEANRAMFDKKIDSMTENVDVIILPEMFTTGFTMNPQHIHISEGRKTVEWMHRKADEKKAVIIGSIVYFENGNHYNRLLFAAPNRSETHYDKRHTFTLAGEHEVYERGNEQLIEKYKGFVFCPLICYDLRFPVWSRNTFDYDILIYVANWPKPRVAAWDNLLQARAIENMAYCIGVNRLGLDGLGHEYSGHSAVYDVLGNKLAYSEKEEVLYATLTKEHIVLNREKLRFLDDRDEFTLVR
ncbi:nitrilase family protein [Muricauda sp. SCSIO 65647]|nr:nitrilase family protein [Muricauda sp. SCSIO 65647]